MGGWVGGLTEAYVCSFVGELVEEGEGPDESAWVDEGACVS